MYSFEYHLKAAFVVAPIWVMAQLAFDYSLLMTTVTANSMLSSSSAVFTFVVSVYMGLDKFSWMKVAAIVKMHRDLRPRTVPDVAAFGLHLHPARQNQPACLVI